eukprot:CAMPEP_0174338128 /NCGR_PEP_ID=MMETSP0810-20121108/22902_1 /TAXON_ID=73025 ORGANISM="Eutreptiella gymnastica-like, Strain CCMP1594" /NCGR_SAMPLE_ID=MMETSP0810 /ASSEMBLY_ACC=CAM_ASM_000659 /LENGTH=181 /DNA_ID=CAMNT_0015458055 /DNA_START=868 /DNA_END=1411 /DNA_ORIENTATION=-
MWIGLNPSVRRSLGPLSRRYKRNPCHRTHQGQQQPHSIVSEEVGMSFGLAQGHLPSGHMQGGLREIKHGNWAGMSPGPARIVGMLAWNGVGMEPGVRTCLDSQSRADTRVTSDSTCLSPVFIRGVDGLGCHRLANPTSNPSSMHLHLQGRDSACADLGAATFWKIPLHVDAKMLKPPMGPW